MSETEPSQHERARRPRPGIGRIGLLSGIAIAVLAVGAAAGAGGTRLAQRWEPRPVLLLQPSTINAMRPDSPVAIKGDVAEIFGNKFVIRDDTGRALVDLGPRAQDDGVVTNGETVTVQGRFDRGAVHAQLLVHSDGRADAFGPPPRPDRGPPEPPRRPDRGPDALQPPPSPAG